jgi:hypothetical protein
MAAIRRGAVIRAGVVVYRAGSSLLPPQMTCLGMLRFSIIASGVKGSLRRTGDFAALDWFGDQICDPVEDEYCRDNGFSKMFNKVLDVLKG